MHKIRRYQSSFVPKVERIGRTHNGVEIPSAAVQFFSRQFYGICTTNSIGVQRFIFEFVVSRCGKQNGAVRLSRAYLADKLS